ncbi:MAG: hypothetical protein KGI04_04650 [Candidatus Micrarchaeota archaeon]|nr:hypothetical protein [Candidatus Micrarchaeota archaeon]
MRNTRGAFLWITGIMRRSGINFLIVGGFAAKMYGSKRRLADIDIEIRGRHIERLRPLVSRYITFGPGRYLDRHWDLRLMTLRYRGQTIDVCDIDNEKIFDRLSEKWVRMEDTLSGKRMTIYGTRALVMPKRALVAYKKRLGRGVDLEDVRQLTG